MPITYRQHQDTRDGKIYNCVLMPDGKWWSAENLSWEGAGYFYNNDPALGTVHGRLYTLLEAQSAIPHGTHLPTASERDALLVAIPNPDGLALKSTSLWTYPQNGNGNDLYGFSALPSGSAIGAIGPDGPILDDFLDINYVGNIWCADTPDGYFAMSSTSDEVGIGTFPGSTYWLSVRFIVDVFNNPYPFQLFGAPFHGFERGLSCKHKRQIIVDDSMGGTVTLIPVAPESYDEWEIEAEFWVPASYAQQIEAKVPPRGTPTEQAIRLPPRGGEASFPGLLPHESTADYDLYSTPQVTALESLGRKGPRLDLIGYRITFILRSGYIKGGSLVGNFYTTPTTTAPAWLSGKFTSHQIQDWSNQDAVSGNSRPSTNFNPIKHGRRWDVNFNLDHLPTDRANEVVSLFRGVRHSPVTITLDRGPEGLVPTSVYLTELDSQRGAGLWWDGTLKAVLA